MRAIKLLLLVLAAVSPHRVDAQDLAYDEQLEARVWLDRGEEPVLDRGDRVRVFYRSSAPAYGAIFHINTDGVVSMLFPQDPAADPFVLGGRDFRLLFPRSPEWRVEEEPGVGYFFIVASQEPLDFSAFGYDRRAGWDLSSVGEVVYEDPYLAMDEFVTRLIPNWEVEPYALDFLTYSVGETHTYPRFLCYDCHSFQTYASWNPYEYQCPPYQVVVWDDPYFYPAYRYAGTRVVYATPIRDRPRYGVATRVAGSGWAPIVRVRPAPVANAQYKEPTISRGSRPTNAARRPVASTQTGRAIPRVGGQAGAVRASPTRTPARAVDQVRSSSSTTRAATPTRQAAPTRVAASTRQAAPPRAQPGASSTRPTLRRRPSSAVRGSGVGRSPAAGTRPTTGARTRAVVPTRSNAPVRSGSARPTTRPSAGPASGGARPSTRPSSRPRAGSARPATQGPTTGSRPSTVRPSTQRPSTTPSRPPTRVVRPSTGGRPSAGSRPGSSGSRPSARAPTRPRVKPRPPPRRPGG